MIEKMKKVTLLVIESHKREVLKKLRNLGILHVQITESKSEELTELIEAKERLQKALQILPVENKKNTESESKQLKSVYEAVDKVINLKDMEMMLNEEFTQLNKQIDNLEPWGDFNPEDLSFLIDKGVDIHLCEIQSDLISNIPVNTDFLILEKTKQTTKIAVIGKPSCLNINYTEIKIPETGLSKCKQNISKINSELKQVKVEISNFSKYIKNIENEIKVLNKRIEFEQVYNSMQTDNKIAFLEGFIPEKTIGKIKKASSSNNWGLLIENPYENDIVPTLLKNPKWIKIIQPVYDLLGIVPGYHELDISFWFLLFFSIFFAMIVGDAGYGFIILIATILIKIKSKKIPKAPIILFIVLSVCTIIWGAITGTWFGVKAISRHPLFSWMIIPGIASFPDPKTGINTQAIIMNICFTLSLIHLTLAHSLNFLRKIPKLVSLSEIGNILFIWGMYFLIQNIVLQNNFDSNIILALVSIGFILIFIFSYQKGKFIKGIINSLQNLIPIVLGTIGNFSDIISYIRLFAVGLATVEVAKAFNQIAIGIGFNNIIAGFFAVLVILVGHTLNIVMAGMSVIVHGVRLKMLEFSSHLGIEWSGIIYNPFKE